MQQADISRMKQRDRNMKKKRRDNDPLLSLLSTCLPSLLLSRWLHYNYWLLAKLLETAEGAGGKERRGESSVNKYVGPF